MRILFNATAALPGTSGMAHTVGLVSQLAVAAPRHEVVVLSTVEQTFLRQELAHVPHLVAPRLGGGGLRRTAQLQVTLARLARDVAADIIYNKGNFYAPLAGRQVSFIENSSPFSTLRLGEPLWYRTRNRLLRVMSQAALKGATAVIFPTDHARRVITARASVKSRAFVVGYGWELPASGPGVVTAEGTPYILCVSSILPYKNLPVVIDALRLMHDRRTFEGSLLIVGVSGIAGGGYYSDVIRRKIEESNLTARVRMIPPVSGAKLGAIYRGAHCLVMPSLEESFGIPLIEAMGAGTPVVAARVDEADRDRYFIPFAEICQEAAEYFNPFNADTCADAIERATAPGRRSELVRLGQERARFYSWRAAADRTASVLDEIVG